MKVFLKLGLEQNGWQPVWMTDECGRVLHTEPVCTIPVAYGHRWFATLMDGFEADTWSVPLSPPCAVKEAG